MLQLRNRRNQRPRRTNRQPLRLEILEDRTLLNASATTVLDMNGLAVNPNKYSSSDILVRFAETPGSPGGPALAAGTTLGSQLPLATGFYQVNLDPGTTVAKALTAYKAEAGVLDAEPDYYLTVSAVPNDPLLSQQWAVNNTHAEQAWNATTGSPNIIVAVMDTGIDYNSPDLYQNIWINQAEIPNSWYTKTSATSGYNKLVYKSQIHTATPGVITFHDLNNLLNKGLVWDSNGDGRIDAGDLLRSTRQGGWEVAGSTKDGDRAHPDDLFGWNFVSGNNNPLDDNGHGTHVSGILGATGNNRAGIAGVDWNARIMPVKWIGSDGNGSISNFVQAMNYAVQHGAKITNNSWEGAPYSSALLSAFQNAQAHGVISVVAAGNEASNDDITPDYPANLSTRLNSVVAVAATTSSNQLASFSNYGAHSVDLAAPGVNILSTLPGGRYGAMSGTSMATPEVTGAMALVWGLHPSWSYTQVINQVLNTTQKLSSLQGKVKTGGLLNIAAAVGGAVTTASKPTPSPTPPTPSHATSSTHTYTDGTALTIKPWGTAMSTIKVPAGTAIGNLQVRLNISYPTDGKLYIYLIAPNGRTLALADNRGGKGANFTNTLFSDQAATGIGSGKAPFSGTYRPETALSHFNGMATGGTWRLAVRNYGGASGKLLNWSLTITSKGGTTSSVEDSALVNAPATDSSTPDAASVSASTAASETPSVSGQFLGHAGATSDGSTRVNTSATTMGVPSDQVFSSPRFMAQLQNGLLVGKRSSNDQVDPWSG